MENKVVMMNDEEENINMNQENGNNDQNQDVERPYKKRRYGAGETIVHYTKKGVRAVGRGIKKIAPVFLGIAIGAGGALGICTALGGRNNGYNDRTTEEPDVIDGEGTLVEETDE